MLIVCIKKKYNYKHSCINVQFLLHQIIIFLFIKLEANFCGILVSIVAEDFISTEFSQQCDVIGVIIIPILQSGKMRLERITYFSKITQLGRRRARN